MKIFITKRAESHYNSIKKYITENFGEKINMAFEDRVTDFLQLLKNYPEIGSVEIAEKQIRGFQLTKQTRVIYRIKGDSLIILSFFVVKQNPSKKLK